MPRLLIVDPEDGHSMRQIVLEYGFGASIAQTVDEAVVGLKQVQPHLVILDHAATQDGMVLFSKLNGVPTIVCSSADSVSDRVACLKMGADDFLSKPVDPYELIERINAVLRRANRLRPARDTSTITVGDLTIAHKSAQVIVRGQEIHLTPTEFHLLALLAEHPNELLTIDVISRTIWGIEDRAVGHTLQVHIGRLRLAFKRAQLSNPRILTVRARGYRLVFSEKGESS